MTGQGHIPVLCGEVIAALAPRAGALYVDGTFGAGGYSRALLAAAPCQVIGIDRDPDAVIRGQALEREAPGQFTMVHGRFGALDTLITLPPDGIALDIGVSSFHLDQAERGFSFQADGPLDMRMEADGPSAADVVNGASESDLADIIFHYGEEPAARRIARALVAARAINPITRTLDLANLVAKAAPRREAGRHPATRTFQALRIHVNDELGELARGLMAAERRLPCDGRLAVVTFHSLEDRVVKRFFAAAEADRPVASRHLPETKHQASAASFEPLFKGAKAASASEIGANPRARSAKLRAGKRTHAAPRTWSARDLGLPAIVELAA